MAWKNKQLILLIFLIGAVLGAALNSWHIDQSNNQTNSQNPGTKKPEAGNNNVEWGSTQDLSPAEYDYRFYQGYDGAPGFQNTGTTDLVELLQLCEETPTCTGFNTDGWLSAGSTHAPSKLTSLDHPGKGLWQKSTPS